MKYVLIITFFVTSMFLLPVLNAAPEPGYRTVKSSKSNKEIGLIKNSAKLFTEAFNNSDANAIAALFTSNADYIGENGMKISGREEIRKDFEDIFQNKNRPKLKLEILSIRLISQNVAVEDGRSILDPLPAGPDIDRRYTVIHVKNNGQWLMKSVRESKSVKISNDDTSSDNINGGSKLHELDWLVGEWVDESPDSVVMTTCKWTENKKYLLRKYSVQHDGKKDFNGVQRIGWDPLTKRIKSWVFDSEGSFGEGVWTRDGNNWIVTVSFVLPDGRTASAKNVFEFTSKDSYIWSSTNRVAGGIASPDILNVKIVKKPPAPSIK